MNAYNTQSVIEENRQLKARIELLQRINRSLEHDNAQRLADLKSLRFGECAIIDITGVVANFSNVHEAARALEEDGIDGVVVKLEAKRMNDGMDGCDEPCFDKTLVLNDMGHTGWA